MIQQISKTITAPIAELYREAMPEQNGGAENISLNRSLRFRF